MTALTAVPYMLFVSPQTHRNQIYYLTRKLFLSLEEFLLQNPQIYVIVLRVIELCSVFCKDIIVIVLSVIYLATVKQQ